MMVSLLDRRIYSLSDVDRLLVLPPGTARRWIDGYDRGGVHYPPVVRAERTRDEEVTWGSSSRRGCWPSFAPVVRPCIGCARP
jgi:hypothetical protein